MLSSAATESPVFKAPRVPAEVVRAAKQSQSSAWRVLFEAYQPVVTAYCYVCAKGRRELALDWTQDIFASAMAHLHQLADEERFEGWLFTIARNHCRKHHRASERERALVDALGLLLIDQAPELASDDYWVQAVRDACSGVENPLHREVVEAHYLKGEKTRELARRLEVPHGTVTVTLMRFRNRLKKQLLQALANGELP